MLPYHFLEKKLFSLDAWRLAIKVIKYFRAYEIDKTLNVVDLTAASLWLIFSPHENPIFAEKMQSSFCIKYLQTQPNTILFKLDLTPTEKTKK